MPNRLHQVIDRYVGATPHRVALIDDKTTLTYRELDHKVEDTADALHALGVRCDHCHPARCAAGDFDR